MNLNLHTNNLSLPARIDIDSGEMIPHSSGEYCYHEDVCKCLGQRDAVIAEIEAALTHANARTLRLVEAVELIKETIVAHEIESLDCDDTEAIYCECLIKNTNIAVTLAAEIKAEQGGGE